MDLYKKDMAENTKSATEKETKPQQSTDNPHIAIDEVTHNLSEQQILDLNKLAKKESTENKDENLAEDRIAKDLVKSGSIIKAQIKALVARDIFGESEYYQVINTEIIEAYSKAIEIISNEAVYNKLLSGKN
jgi:carboxyl-terminal processing protease